MKIFIKKHCFNRSFVVFRRTLLQSFLFKFYSHVGLALRQSLSDLSYLPYHRGISHAQQTTPEKPATQKIVGSSMQHRSAYCHATGEAIYFDDMPSLIDTLHGAFVLSTKAHARIKNISMLNMFNHFFSSTRNNIFHCVLSF